MKKNITLTYFYKIMQLGKVLIFKEMGTVV